jgi:predicted dinucleotide-binding enzyme
MTSKIEGPARPIAIIGGTGPAGMGLALRWVRAGETVIIGSREESRAVQAASSIKARVGDQSLCRKMSAWSPRSTMSLPI